MRRGPSLWMLAAVVATLALIGAAAAGTASPRAFTLGVSPDDQAIGVYADREACQQPIDVPVSFQSVAFEVSGDEPSGPPLAVEVRSFPDGRRLARGVLDETYVDATRHAVRVGEVPAGGRIAVCFRALGEGGEAGADEGDGARLAGGPSQASRTSAVFLNGVERPDDLTLVFIRDRPSTLLSLVPAMLERAALWRPGPASGVLMGVLLLIALTAAPLLLGRAVARAFEEPGSGAAEGPEPPARSWGTAGPEPPPGGARPG